MTATPKDFKLLPYLLYLAKVEKGGKPVSTSSLAREFGFSQQTASRLLRELESAGLVRREVTPRGQFVGITKKAEEIFFSISSELDSILKKQVSRLSFRGKLVSGLGEGAYYMSRPLYVRQFKHLLGYEPFPGTLNIKLPHSELQKKVRLSAIEHAFISGFKSRGRSFGFIRCYPCSINRKVAGHVLVPERTHHPEDVLEIASKYNLKKRLSLKEGETVLVEISA